jgi:ribosomal protein L40E
MAIFCASCGMENVDEATVCRRCRAVIAPESPRERDVGQLCARCESYNEPAVERCTTCGYKLPPGHASASAPEEPSAETSVAAAEDDVPLAFALEEPTAGEDATPRPPEPATKQCANCRAENPSVARFCFECGTPFGIPPPVARSDEQAASPDEWATTTDPSAWAAPELNGGEEHALSAEDLGAELVTAPVLAAEVPPPFVASLVVERGTAPGSTFALDRIENVVGAAGANVELSGDPHLASRTASISFVEERLLIRDEGSTNGVYLKLRESSALAPGDLFVAGERLIRYDGFCELERAAPVDTPRLGSPLPEGGVVRLCEVLRGGRLGRICYRAGPIVSVGRTNCDLNFPHDAQLAARHAEVRIGPGGNAKLVDVGASPSGVFVRVGTQQERELTAGDVLQIGDQVLRVEFDQQ